MNGPGGIFLQGNERDIGAGAAMAVCLGILNRRGLGNLSGRSAFPIDGVFHLKVAIAPKAEDQAGKTGSGENRKNRHQSQKGH